MKSLPVTRHPDLLVGYETSDDAGVFRLREDLALVQTVDFITPVVDDPFSFGMIAAANSLSDVWAMGGRPVTAMNILCFPSDDLPLAVAKEVLRGGYEKILEGGAVLVGGHSIKDRELKYGLSVSGLIHPQRILTNQGARPGDRIILTKALGTGIIATAIKGGAASPGAIAALVASAATLNRTAAEVMAGFEAHACTDITGFGLGGHLLEVARASRVELTVTTHELPFLPQTEAYARDGLIPGGAQANRMFCRDFYELSPGLDPLWEDLVFDPQTSGGLAIFMAPAQAGNCLQELRRRGIEAARLIGEVTGTNACGRLRLA